MTAREVIEAANRAGVTASADGDELALVCDGEVPPAIQLRLEQLKAEILKLLSPIRPAFCTDSQWLAAVYCEMSTRLHIGDYGTAIVMRFADVHSGAPVDISTAISLVLIVVKPSGAIARFPMQPLTDGKDGKSIYVTSKGDLDEAGHYRLQGFVQTPLLAMSSTVTGIEVLEG